MLLFDSRLGAVSTFYYLFASVNFGVVIEECLRIEKHKLLILEKENQGCSRVTECNFKSLKHLNLILLILFLCALQLIWLLIH